MKCKIINLHTVSECAFPDTFFCNMFPLLLLTKCLLGENIFKSQSVIEYLLCVAGIEECKSDTFHVTDARTFYEMVALPKVSNYF